MCLYLCLSVCCVCACVCVHACVWCVCLSLCVCMYVFVYIYLCTAGHDYGRVCQTTDASRTAVRGIPEGTVEVQAELCHSRHHVHFTLLHRAMCVGLEKQPDVRQGNANGN